MQIVTLQVEHPCPVADPIRRTPGARGTHFFHRGPRVAVGVRAEDPRALEHLVRVYTEGGAELLDHDARRGSAMVQFTSCPCCSSGRVVSTIERSGHQYLPPVRYFPEGERYQFLVLRGAVERTILSELRPTVRVTGVVSKPVSPFGVEEEFLVPWGAVAGGITERQRQALVLGIREGYFDTPRRVSSVRLAGRFGISRPAFDKLLRRAEERLLEGLTPFLTATTIAQELAAKTSPPTHPRTRPGRRRRRGATVLRRRS